MNLTIKLISDMQPFTITDKTGKTLDDYYEQMIDQSTPFIKIGNKILQKSTIEYIDGE
ncbi:hypothetical protein [Enterococcus wangshanyuanii]|uniref:Uncharacterized protein n=1 Tax=Enterococcus wangshanyuanii TaxID=2005703 RepID=A0ABQ1PU50_9ENTE|nr:hypothetical protein [Enterococcus wangshanyuanii]GGD03764.1 hypothetical protein GCM10011573_36560 [Enterococcus wangshanyuanii]